MKQKRYGFWETFHAYERSISPIRKFGNVFCLNGQYQAWDYPVVKKSAPVDWYIQPKEVVLFYVGMLPKKRKVILRYLTIRTLLLLKD